MYERKSQRPMYVTKVVIVEAERDGIDRDIIGSSEDLIKLVFIDEKCGNLKVVVDGR